MRAYKCLVVLQPTPFCNIDCKYCYLPHRSNTQRMSDRTLDRVFAQVFSSELVGDPIVFLWHLGEPLAVPPSWYERAFSIARAASRAGRQYTHSFQTNGTLITPEWIEFIRRHGVSIGVSIDGPAPIHDRLRVTRSGSPTHAAVMRGIRLLQASGTSFATIMVLTTHSLDRADEICDFLLDNDIHDVGFNIDEIEGIHRSSSFESAADGVTRFKAFFRRMLERSEASDGRLRIREVWTNLRALTKGIREGPDSDVLNTTNRPFRIFNIDSEGNFSTFCPELVAARSPEYSNFVMGNVHTDRLDDIVSNPVFVRVNREVQAGVRRCRESCEYWEYCGGGSPSNKFFEHGTFDATESVTCRLHRKAVIDVLVDYLEHRLHLAPQLAAGAGEIFP